MPVSPTAPDTYSEIRARLAAAKRKEDVVALANGLVYTTLVVLTVGLVVVVFEELLYFSVVTRTILFWGVVTATLVLVATRIVRPLLRLGGVLKGDSDSAIARRVGLAIPAIRDHLVNILQLLTERERAHFYSPELIDESFADVRKETEQYDFTSIANYTDTKRLGKTLGVVSGVSLLLVVLFPASFSASFHRLAHYDTSFEPPALFKFIVEPGNKEVVKGQSVPITVRVEGARQKDVTLATKPEGQLEFEHRKLEAMANGMFKYEVPSLKSSTRYFVSSGDVRSDEYMLSVIDRPTVGSLLLRLVFPSYSKLSAQDLDENAGDVTALKGTRVSYKVRSNKELSSAILVFDDMSTLPLDVRGNEASGGIVLQNDHTYHIPLKDKEGIGNAEPIEYTLKVVADAYPTATIEIPGQNIDIAGNTSLNMLFRINDDYGFTQLRLAYKLIQSRYEQPATDYTYVQVPLPGEAGNEVLLPYVWDLSRLSLVPEDVVSYYIEVFDNDDVSGPKSARSEVYTLRLPSLDEVFADVDKRPRCESGKYEGSAEGCPGSQEGTGRSPAANEEEPAEDGLAGSKESRGGGEEVPGDPEEDRRGEQDRREDGG